MHKPIRARIIKIIAFVVLIGVIIGLPCTTLAQGSATVQTDKDNYLLGEPVVITGSGFIPGPISITVLRPDHRIVAVQGVIANSNGSFQRIYYPPRFLPLLPDYVPGLTPGRYKMTATDGLNSADTAYTVNSKPSEDKGRIILIKETIPSGAPATFHFDMDYGSVIAYPNGLIMRDGAILDSGYVLEPGIHIINENSAPSGWQLSDIDIKDNSGGSYSSGNQSFIDLAPGETVTVTYTNTLFEPVDNKGSVKTDLIEFQVSPTNVVGSAILNATANGKLIINVNLDTEPNLQDYDVLVFVRYTPPPWPAPPPPPPGVVKKFTDILNTNAQGQGNVILEVDIDPPSINDRIWVIVNVGPQLPPPQYTNMPPPVEVPIK